MDERLLPFVEFAPAPATELPVVVSSPHSGTIYPPSLLELLRPTREELRLLEDGPLDQMARAGVAAGATALCATFARAWIDLNRAPEELDPELVDGEIPGSVASVRAKAGLGLVPSRLSGRALYRRRLSTEEIAHRLAQGWRPYHLRLGELLAAKRRRFGSVLLLDLHSMPTEVTLARGRRALDVAIGDCHHRACAGDLAAEVETALLEAGLHVARNTPYAGGYITERWGRPAEGVHALQLEFRRSLFMDEQTGLPTTGLFALAELFAKLVLRLGVLLVPAVLRAAE
ncbi:MAG: N-formylglutamate amidohydrolase [Geminicoccaceae bacterium]|nr:N-formylglutamate amidohydrolase [Geminicoccaceae bacterium]MDW8341369.1 N-formylglutamate amidohydrolase [Geminicoccaceae bacterium]